MITVAILCCSRSTLYKGLENVDLYDEDRDARTFKGGTPIVAHPPCRRWTTYGLNMMGVGNHKIIPKDQIQAERDLGVWCALQVKKYGGILEQPANSQLWHAANLPVPNSRENRPDSFSICVHQSRWGLPTHKKTWLYFRGIDRSLIVLPPRQAVLPGDSKRIWVGDLKHLRSLTTESFAQWLVDLARQAKVCH
jgi:hypothetical protein